MEQYKSLPFLKIHGSRNVFIVIDESELAPDCGIASLPALARYACAYQGGVGSDGLMVVGREQDGVIPVRMFNPDGSSMGMCGNGIRCVVRALFQWGSPMPGRTRFMFEVEGRSIACGTETEGRSVEVSMGPPSFEPTDIPFVGDSAWIGRACFLGGRERIVTLVSMGNPHCVTDDHGEALELVGPQIECDPLFPRRTNVEFVRVLGRREIAVRVWERGAGITAACGTGNCASVVAFARRGLIEPECTVRLPGGVVEVYWDQAQNQVYLRGPTEFICSGLAKIPYSVLKEGLYDQI
jgi:diaminopimelate epimerase